MTRIAILKRDGSFSDRWASEVTARGLEPEVMSPYSADTTSRIRECSALLWHPDHERAEDLLLMEPILRFAEALGKPTFPDHGSRWHFDDKIAQAFLFQAIGAPTPRTHVFVLEQEALAFLQSAQLPIVAKLKRGAGSANVRLIRTVAEGKAYIRRSFGAGHKAVSGYFVDVRTRVKSTRSLDEALGKLQRLPRAVLRRRQLSRAQGRERGYVLFQEFLPENTHDTRITVIGDRAFGYRRFVRANDFRASGSRNLDTDPAKIEQDCVQLAFEIADRIGAGCLAMDFIRDPAGQPSIVEVSFGFNPEYVAFCPGYWNRELTWTDGAMRPEAAIVDDLLTKLAHANGAAA